MSAWLWRTQEGVCWDEDSSLSFASLSALINLMATSEHRDEQTDGCRARCRTSSTDEVELMGHRGFYIFLTQRLFFPSEVLLPIVYSDIL